MLSLVSVHGHSLVVDLSRQRLEHLALLVRMVVVIALIIARLLVFGKVTVVLSVLGVEASTAVLEGVLIVLDVLKLLLLALIVFYVIGFFAFEAIGFFANHYFSYSVCPDTNHPTLPNSGPNEYLETDSISKAQFCTTAKSVNIWLQTHSKLNV